MTIFHMSKPRQWKALFCSALIALGILIGEGEYMRRIFFDQPHAEGRGYEPTPTLISPSIYQFANASPRTVAYTYTSLVPNLRFPESPYGEGS